MNQRHLGGNTCWPSSFYYEFSESVVVAGEEREVFSSFNNHDNVNCSGEKKYNEEFRGVYFFDNTRKNFKSNLVLVVVLVLESKGLYWPFRRCVGNWGEFQI